MSNQPLKAPTLLERLRGDNCHCRMAREAADEIERQRTALAAADVMAHTLYHGGPGQAQHAGVMDAYWAARGGSDACVVCSPPSGPETAP